MLQEHVEIPGATTVTVVSNKTRWISQMQDNNKIKYDEHVMTCLVCLLVVSSFLDVTATVYDMVLDLSMPY